MSKHARQDDPAATHTSSVHKITKYLVFLQYLECGLKISLGEADSDNVCLCVYRRTTCT